MIINRELFEAWLFSQDRERLFDFNDCRNCLLGSFIKEQVGLQFFTVLGRKAVYDGVDYEHPDWFIKLTEKWIYESSKGPLCTKLHSFGEAQDSYLQLFPNTLDSNQSQTEGVTVSPQQQRETAVNSPLKTQ